MIAEFNPRKTNSMDFEFHPQLLTLTIFMARYCIIKEIVIIIKLL